MSQRCASTPKLRLSCRPARPCHTCGQRSTCALDFAIATQIRNVEREQRGPENALIASVMLAAMQAAIYMVLSAFVLLGRWCSAEVHVGLWFAVIIALSFSVVFGFLPAALMAWGFLDEVRSRHPRGRLHWPLPPARLCGVVRPWAAVCVVRTL